MSANTGYVHLEVLVDADWVEAIARSTGLVDGSRCGRHQLNKKSLFSFQAMRRFRIRVPSSHEPNTFVS